MTFYTDKQTLDDLNLLGKFREGSIFNLFNKVQTPGGERLLEEFFRTPLNDATQINQRASIFRYFHTQQQHFPFNPNVLHKTEEYLAGSVPKGYMNSVIRIFQRKVSKSILHNKVYDGIVEGINATIEIIRVAHTTISTLDIPQAPMLRKILNDHRLKPLIECENKSVFSVPAIAKYDLLFRRTLHLEMEKIMSFIAELDVYIAVSGVAREQDFTYATAVEPELQILQASAIRHPALTKSVANRVDLNSNSNMIFLTGANMAGKSTFMKSFGIALYLAHMGFPVAAGKMIFSVRDGIFSSINVTDSLAHGYSHFYAEVRRVKKVAEEVSSGRNLVVLFDELFKGTNVKDAYDATLACTAAFSGFNNCLFIISTHIIEVGEALGRQHQNIQFAFMPTIMRNNIPEYTYTLRDGITADRHGMMIIEAEGILDMLESD